MTFYKETKPTTQQSIYPTQPTLKTPHNENQSTNQSTVKPSVIPKYSRMDYQTNTKNFLCTPLRSILKTEL